jgi:hypothetical protein
MVLLISAPFAPISPSLEAQYLLHLVVAKNSCDQFDGHQSAMAFVGSFSANESHSRDSFSSDYS